MSKDVVQLIPLNIIKEVLAELDCRLVARLYEDDYVRIWIHLNDFRFVDFDQLTQAFAKRSIEVINDEDKCEINEIHLKPTNDTES